MSKELTQTNTNGGAIAPAENYKEIAIQWLTSTGNLNKFTENQKAQFIDICCAYGLNPIKKEVYGVAYKDKFNLIVGYESYIKRAERSGRLNGWGVEIIGNKPNMKAVITIYRKDFERPFIHEVYFDEYNTNQNLWVTKPRTMLRKVAIAQGFRMCFSEELGGMPYTADELPEEMTAETAPTVKAEITNITSETPIKNITPKNEKIEKPAIVSVTTVENAEKNGFSEPSKNKLVLKLYTPEEAQSLGEVMNSVYSSGEPIFTGDEKASYKTMLMSGEFENAMTSAQNLRAQRLSNEKATSEMLDNMENEGFF